MSRRLSERLIRWLVRLMPVDVREAHGTEMRQVLSAADRDRPRGTMPALGFWLAALLDMVRAAPRQHAQAIQQDVRYTLRGLRRAPGFAIAAVLTVALGTGAALAVFAVVNAVLIRPLPFEDPSRVALVWAVDPSGVRTWLSVPELDDISTHASSLEAVAGLTDLRLAMTGAGTPEELDVIAASAELFPLLGIRPHLGRLPDARDDHDSAARVAVLSHRFWTTRFGAQPDVIGRSLTLDGRTYTVIGVLPRTFAIVPPSSVFPRDADAWVALQPHVISRARDVRYLHALARVRSGISYGVAREELAAVGATRSSEFASAYRRRRWTFDVVSMQDDVVSGIRPALLVLLGIVAVVLLIACINVAALLLARADGRRTEMAVRAALGASRGRLVRQLLTEGFVLAALGTSVGLLLALAAPGLARVPEIGSLPRFSDLSVDWRVPVFAAFVAVLVSVLFALAPAMELGQRMEAMRSSSRSRQSVRVSRMLMVSEVALASTALVLALVLARSLSALLDVHPGFTTANVAAAHIALPPHYANAQQINRFYDDVIERLEQVPGVEAAGAVTQLPLSGAMLGSTFVVADPARADTRIDVDLRGATAGYFRAMQIPIVRGRGFSAADRAHSPPVALIDETTARRLWPDRDPVGQRLRWIRQPDIAVEIIGVAGAIRHRGVALPPRPTIYRPHTQYARPSMFVVAASRPGQTAPTGALVDRVHAVDRNQPVSDVTTLAALRKLSFAQPGFGAALGSALALLALALTAVGVYGLYAFAVVQRRREVGVRLAVGGTPGRVERMILSEGARTTVFGLCLGLPCGTLAARAVRGFVPGTVGLDAATLVLASAVMLIVGLLACWIPARRASRVNPVEILRG